MELEGAEPNHILVVMPEPDPTNLHRSLLSGTPAQRKLIARHLGNNTATAA